MYFYNRQVGVIVHMYMHNTHRHVSIHTPRRGSGSVSGLKVVYGEKSEEPFEKLCQTARQTVRDDHDWHTHGHVVGACGSHAFRRRKHGLHPNICTANTVAAARFRGA